MKDDELTLIDKFLLLLTYDGEMARLQGAALQYAVAGAVLMELEHQGFIDSDQENVILLSMELPDDSVLAEAHKEIIRKGTMRIKSWLDWMAVKATDLCAVSIERLVQRGFLVKKTRRSMFVLKREYYESAGGYGSELRRRIFDTLASDEIPVPEDIRLICLADATGLLRKMFNEDERQVTNDRVSIIRRLDLVGQVTAVAIEDADFSMFDVEKGT